MLSFGAFFGNTVMTRLAVFLERVEFPLHDWLRLIHGKIPSAEGLQPHKWLDFFAG
jgi:hypothetical protein